MRKLLWTAALGILLVAAPLGFAGCTTTDSDVAGTWQGTRSDDNGEADFTMVLTQNDSNVSGSYTDTSLFAGVISGQIDVDDVTLTMTTTSAPPPWGVGEIWVFTGTLDGDRLSGTLDASGIPMNWSCTR